MNDEALEHEAAMELERYDARCDDPGDEEDEEAGLGQIVNELEPLMNKAQILSIVLGKLGASSQNPQGGAGKHDAAINAQ